MIILFLSLGLILGSPGHDENTDTFRFREASGFEFIAFEIKGEVIARSKAL